MSEGTSKRRPPGSRTIIAVSRFGGLPSPSEKLSMRWVDVDLESRSMKIAEKGRNAMRRDVKLQAGICEAASACGRVHEITGMN